MFNEKYFSKLLDIANNVLFREITNNVTDRTLAAKGNFAHFIDWTP